MAFKLYEPLYNRSGKITINGTTFDGDSVLNAVYRVSPLPFVGIGGAWYRHQIVTPAKYEASRQKITNEHFDALDRGEIQPGPCYSAKEITRGGWKFLYWVNSRGDLCSECFTVAG